jgi:hypothetical protein
MRPGGEALVSRSTMLRVRRGSASGERCGPSGAGNTSGALLTPSLGGAKDEVVAER